MIEHVIRHVVERVPLSSGDDLTGFLIDADHFLNDHPSFQSATVKSTDDPLQLVSCRVEVAETVPSLQDISDALTQCLRSLLYTDFSASSTILYDNATVSRFVTAISPKLLCVTGTIVASAPHYDDLALLFVRDFGSTHGPLPTWTVK